MNRRTNHTNTKPLTDDERVAAVRKLKRVASKCSPEALEALYDERDDLYEELAFGAGMKHAQLAELAGVTEIAVTKALRKRRLEREATA